ncbi:hypothetical protein Cgig2_031444 [Carnegiea gigantea]|uniref:Alkyl transferase n=1 Tax=Carnegiea gigantea TaxID=171969 RepID=A0A9Q1K7S3_9CARY|nr:hypothetical protein Cgig2_031444 [Carnegiea gigantea]
MSSLQIPTITTTSFSLLKHHPQPHGKPTNYYPLFLPHHPSCTSPPLARSLSKLQNPRLAAETSSTAEETAVALPEGLRPELMPQHVAVITDGNGRWARQRGLPRSVGHLAGGEVDFIMSLLEKGLQSETERFVSVTKQHHSHHLQSYRIWHNNNTNLNKDKIWVVIAVCMNREGIRVSMIGDLLKLPTSIQKWVAQVEEKTKDNTKVHLIVAVSYSGKYDITKACRSIAQKVKDGLIQVEDVNEELIERELETKCTQFPHPDLLIRTSGELRISNFLLWQLAYTELFFSRALWPDVGEEDFAEALRSFQQRNRRFGGRDLHGSSEK